MESKHTIYADAVIWKATRIWREAETPDEKATAIDELGSFLMKIPNETKRSSYLTELQKQLKIKDSLLKKRVTFLVKDAEIKKAEKIAKAKLENEFAAAEDAGLPHDFNGNIYDALKYGVYEYNGVYRSKGPKGDYDFTNFTMEILYHADTGDDAAYRLISIKNVWGFETVINLNTDDFVSLGPFKKIIARRGNYIFKGTDADLSRLQEYLQKDEKKTKFIGALGYQRQGNFWAWANGIVPLKAESAEDNINFIPIDEHGIVSNKDKHYFIPYGSQLYADKDGMFENEKKFSYQVPENSISFKKWNELFCKAYLPEKAIPATLHYLGALFRDIVMKRVQRFPLLNLFGPPQSGKGTLAESIMYMFGELQDQIMLEGQSTPKGFMRRFGQLVNGYVWLDEYKNHLSADIKGSIKNLFDGKGYTRAKRSNDLQTDTTPVYASCLLSGQDLPTGEAGLFDRIIPLFFDAGRGRTVEQTKSFNELREMEITGGFPYITSMIVQYRNLVQENFEKAFKTIYWELKQELVNPVIDDRFINNISILLAFRQMFNGILDFAFTYEEAKAVLVANVVKHQVLKQGNDDVAKFWQVVEYLFSRGILRDNKEFILEDGFIYICIAKTHPEYVKEMIARRDPSHLAKSTLEHYLKQDKDVFADYVRKRFKDGTNPWCYKMKYSKLNIDLIKLDEGGAPMSEAQKQNLIDQKYKEMNITEAFVPIEGDGF